MNDMKAIIKNETQKRPKFIQMKCKSTFEINQEIIFIFGFVFVLSSH